MVLYVKPACQLCEIFFKSYEAAAETFKDTNNLLFTIIDLSKNDIDSDLVYFPYVSFFTTNSKKQPVEYDSGTEARQVIDFVKKYATVTLFKEFEGRKEDL